MTGRIGKRSKAELAKRLRATLEAIDAGRITVSGDGHSLATTRARLEARIAKLEGGARG